MQDTATQELSIELKEISSYCSSFWTPNEDLLPPFSFEFLMIFIFAQGFQNKMSIGGFHISPEHLHWEKTPHHSAFYCVC